MEKISTRLILIIAAAVLLFMLIAIIIIFSFSDKSIPEKSVDTPTPASPTLSAEYKSLTIRDAPTIGPEDGGGTNINSQIVKNSATEIENIAQYLPFETSFTSTQGVDVEILIPKANLQINNHTLRVQVFGINYNTSPDQPDYEIMMQSFLEATNLVFDWMNNNNADSGKIIFVWGDQSFIQNRAEGWLNESN